MNDNLRSRINAVLNQHYPITNDGEPTEWCWCGMPRDHVADAVIAELRPAIERPERTCQLCGRVGTLQFAEARTGWVCRSAYACKRRVRDRRYEMVK